MWISAGADQCEAHGQCAMASQELFPLDEDGYTTLAHAPREVPAGSEDLGRRGSTPARCGSCGSRRQGLPTHGCPGVLDGPLALAYAHEPTVWFKLAPRPRR